MTMSRCFRPARILGLFLLLAFGASLAGPAGAQEPWEAEVERARKQQDREIKSAQAAKKGFDALIRRYKQQVINAGTPLNYYLLGRIYFYADEHDYSIEAMAKVLARAPRYWQADRALTQLYAMRKRLPEARRHAEDWLRKKPDDAEGQQVLVQILMMGEDFKAAYNRLRVMLQRKPDDWNARRMVVECLLALKQWKLARGQLRKLIVQFPRELAIRSALVQCHMELKDWRAAVVDLKQLLHARPKEPLLLWQLSVCLFELANGEKAQPAEREGWLAEALGHVRALDALQPGRLHVLGLLDAVLGSLGRHAERLPVLERMRPLLKDKPEDLARLEELIAGLKQALARGAAPAEAGAPQWKRDPMVELLERIAHSDPAIRRSGLLEYLKSDVPYLDPVVYQRCKASVEPDPDCRLLVVRILGKYRAGEADPPTVRQVAFLLAGVLELDPESAVRVVAAEELGTLGVKVAVAYLIPQIEFLPLDRLPPEAEARTALEREYNACRLALRAVTGHADVPVTGSNWIAAEAMVENRKHWIAWLNGPEGVAVRLAAVRELREFEQHGPAYALRYTLSDIMRDGPAPPALVLPTYRTLRDWIAKARAEGTLRGTIADFPNVPDAELTEAGLPALRERVKAWYLVLKQENAKREQEKKAAGSGGK
jgi:tetratricopeptide (TPR) repeat protein